MSKRKKPRLEKWTPFERVHFSKQYAIDGGSYEVYANSRYQVTLDRMYDDDGVGTHAMWLSMKHLDRRANITWRDKQRIKNELCGPEAEAVEIYPAESRLVDSSNQYHIWVFKPGEPLNMGYSERLVLTPAQLSKEAAGLAGQGMPKQAQFEAHHNADGCAEHGLAGWGSPPKHIEWLICEGGATYIEKVPLEDWVRSQERP